MWQRPSDDGVVSPLGVAPGLERKVLAAIQMVPVAGPGIPSPLIGGHYPSRCSSAPFRSCCPKGAKEKPPAQRAERAVKRSRKVSPIRLLSSRTWRVGDLHTKHALLRANLGWGNLPEHLARADLKAGKLVPLRPQAWAEGEHRLHLSAIYRASTALGPAHAWMLDALEQHCLRELAPQKKNRTKKSAPPKRR